MLSTLIGVLSGAVRPTWMVNHSSTVVVISPKADSLNSSNTVLVLSPS